MLRDIRPRGFVGVAFCRNDWIRFADAAEKVLAVKVELHYQGHPSVVCHFSYKMKGKTATVLECCTDEDLFSET